MIFSEAFWRARAFFHLSVGRRFCIEKESITASTHNRTCRNETNRSTPTTRTTINYVSNKVCVESWSCIPLHNHDLFSIHFTRWIKGQHWLRFWRLVIQIFLNNCISRVLKQFINVTFQYSPLSTAKCYQTWTLSFADWSYFFLALFGMRNGETR